MSSKGNGPGSLREAIEKLEGSEGGTGKNGRSSLADDVENLKRAIGELRPHLQKISESASETASEIFNENVARAKKATTDVEKKIEEHPWWALGIVGLVAFLIGYLLGRKD